MKSQQDLELERKEIERIFKEQDAIWMHDGDPKSPHAELTTGLCSNGYVNCRNVLQYPLLCRMLAKRLYYKMLHAYVAPHIDLVIGSPYSAITFSHEFAAISGSKHGFTEKDPRDPKGKQMIWKGDTVGIKAVLQIEELITTRHTLLEVRRAISEVNFEPIQFLPVVGCIVHRPQNLATDYDGIKVISLLDMEIWASKPEDCHLCKGGSRRLKPRANWVELTGKK